ncbi:MAG: secretin N-terminal domain-containing protein [Candidatus Firestonebacteria bacterium]
MKKILIGCMLMLVSSIGWAQTQVYVEPPLEFTDTPIKTALETIFLKAGVVSYSIEVSNMENLGLVTLKLTERTELEALLTLVLQPKGLEFKKDEGGVYHIKKQGAVGVILTPRITKLYALTYATAGELVRQVKGVLTKEGVISVDIGTNSLIITDDPSVFEGVENLLKELDNPERKAKLIAIKSKLIEISKVVDTTLSIDAQYTKGAGISIGGGTLTGTGAWTGTSFATASLISGGGGFFLGPFSWTNGMDTIVSQLFATTGSTSIDMIAEPDLLVEDGTEARIQVGTKEPLVLTSEDDDGDVTTTVTYQDVFIILTVTPQSQRDGTISVQINPQLNQIAGFVWSPSGTVPRIDNREVRTKLFVNNGGTIRLGGMFKDRTTISETKIPFIGDIPLIGLLFKSTNPITDRIELQILVSPHIADYAPPRCKDTPWISILEASMAGDMDVKIDWSKDLPFGANGIFSYNVYRDVQPIENLEDRKPFAGGISGDATSWIDMSKKRRGGTYYYVVTSVNPSGMEQSISPDPKFNAVITIPEK